MGTQPLATQVSIVIIDDHPAIVSGVVSWCAQAEPAIQVAATGEHVAVAWTEPGRSAPIVLLDLQLRGSRLVFDELGELADSGRSVIVYSQQTDQAAVRRCLDLGAFTYLTKDEGHHHLIPAIRAASQNLPYVSPALGGALVGDTAAHRPVLSKGETDALTAWFHSSSKRLAAATLNISPDTLKTYIERARLKYAAVGRPAPTKAALLERAYQDGILDWPTTE